jgi:predicted AlkP superfamily phosphohydrolase/phosphomutase
MEMRVPEGREDSVLTHVHDILERRWEAVRDLYQREDWDLFWVVFTQTDRIQHMFWGYMEPYDPRFTPEHARQYENAVHDLWVRQDEILGELLAMTDPSTTVLMVSDHGFGPISREIRVYPHLRRQNESKLLRETASQIYSIDPTNASQLYVQVKGRDAAASLDEEAQKKVVEELRRVLDETVDPETGERIVARSWLNEEVFYGTYRDKGPDVTFLPKPGYFLFKAEADAFNEDIDPVGPLSFSLTGWHQMNGIYALRGPCAAPGRRDDDGGGRRHNLMDVTPTLLYLLGRPVPEGLDGRVMTNILRSECFENRPVEVGPAFDEYGFEGDEIPDSTEIERLKALPYIGG